jgi:hypothetical protein
VLLEAHRAIPAIFALSAGYGDMAIGVTAALVAWQLAEPHQRSAFIAWQLLGITDFVVAVSFGNDCGAAAAAWSFDGGDDSAAVKSGGDLSGTVVFHFSSDLHCAGEKLEECRRK